jgi:uncharacterized protein with FMN-binding domain
MRRFSAVFVATVTGLVVLLSFKTTQAKAPRPAALSGVTPGATSAPPGSSAPVSSAPVGSAPVSSAPASSAAPSTAAPTPTPKPSSTTKTVTGSAITVGEGRRVFGVVQVQLTLTNGKITAATAIQSPQNDSRSSQISQYSIPTLSGEVLSAQSASIDAVSGATYTSNAYAQSVQAALDAAKA